MGASSARIKGVRATMSVMRDSHRLNGEPCGRGVEAVLGGEFGAVGEYCIRVLLELEPLVVVLMALGSVVPRPA